MAERNDLIAASPASPITERSAEEIRQHIADSRNSITGTVDRLSDRIQQTFDWRTYVADHPLATLSIAAGAGCLLAGIFRPRDTPSERMMKALADNVEAGDFYWRRGGRPIAQSKERFGTTQLAKVAYSFG